MSELNETPNMGMENPNVVNNPVNASEVKQEPVVAQPAPQPVQPVQPAPQQPVQPTPQPAQPNPAPQVKEMVYTRETKKTIREMCSWVKIVAVFLLISLIGAVAAPILMPILIGGATGHIGAGLLVIIPTVIVALILLIPIVRMFKFCSRAKKALKSSDSKLMEEAMKAMSSFWSFNAVIIMLAIIASIITFICMGSSALVALFG